MDRVRDDEHRLTAVEDRAKSNTHRIEQLEGRQSNVEKLVGSISVLASRMETLDSDVKEIKKDVKEMTGRAGRRWDSIVENVLRVITSSILLYVLTRIGF